jgi:hypothetical protein
MHYTRSGARGHGAPIATAIEQGKLQALETADSGSGRAGAEMRVRLGFAVFGDKECSPPDSHSYLKGTAS